VTSASSGLDVAGALDVAAEGGALGGVDGAAAGGAGCAGALADDGAEGAAAGGAGAGCALALLAPNSDTASAAERAQIRDSL
jgi:hypothetical protein